MLDLFGENNIKGARKVRKTISRKEHAKPLRSLHILWAFALKRGGALAAWRGEACEAPSEAKPGR